MPTARNNERARMMRKLFAKLGREDAASVYMEVEDSLGGNTEESDFMKDYPFVNGAKGPELYLYGPIMSEEELAIDSFFFDSGATGVSSISVARALNSFSGGELTVRINSPGGDTSEGSAIAGQLMELRKRGVKLKCIVDGVSASAALWPMVACDEIDGFEMSEYLFHRSWGLCIGNAVAMEQRAKGMRGFDEQTFEALGARVKGGAAAIRKMCDANSAKGTWLSAIKAKEIGLIDTVSRLVAEKPEDDVEILDAERVPEDKAESTEERTAAKAEPKPAATEPELPLPESKKAEADESASEDATAEEPPAQETAAESTTPPPSAEGEGAEDTPAGEPAATETSAEKKAVEESAADESTEEEASAETAEEEVPEEKDTASEEAQASGEQSDEAAPEADAEAKAASSDEPEFDTENWLLKARHDMERERQFEI